MLIPVKRPNSKSFSIGIVPSFKILPTLTNPYKASRAVPRKEQPLTRNKVIIILLPRLSPHINELLKMKVADNFCM